MEVSFSYLCSAGYLVVAVKVASSFLLINFNATNLKSSKTQFQFQFERSLAQLSPSLFIEIFVLRCKKPAPQIDLSRVRLLYQPSQLALS